MIPFWSFILFSGLFTVTGYVFGLHMGRYYEARDRRKR